jgi:glutamyl-tRNA synthetase
MKEVRTRFAPSPTGFLHVGNVRAALFPWLVAKQAGGTFILRIEDTDQAREVEGAVQIMHDTLSWLGIEWDEGLLPNGEEQGEYGPYVQSNRKDIYEKWARQLIDAGRAYADTRTPAELDALREDAKAQKKAFLARDYRPENPPEWQPGMPLRFLSEPKAYDWHDAVMGDMHSGPEVVDDFIMLKSDGFPTYNFAHIVDDAEMQITHVIRGLEYIASVPKYLNLYEALGLEVPVLAHMPHIMNEQGNKKLSKRDGAKSVLQYREEGYLPDAMLNFLASMGWNDGTEQEIFSSQELIEKFSLERVQKSGARFDEKRLEWMQGAHVRALPLEKLAVVIGNKPGAPSFWPNEAFEFSEQYRLQVLGLVQERLKFFSELPSLSQFFFSDLPVDMSLLAGNKQLKKFDPAELKAMLETCRAAFEGADFTPEALQEVLNTLLETTGQKPGVLFSLIRIATTQAPFSPALADTMAILGKDKVLARIDKQVAAL